MPFGAIIGGIGSIFGGISSAGAAKDAAKIQAQAANNATQLQRDIFNSTTGNLAPFLGAGSNALAALQAGTGTAGGAFDPNAPLLQSATSALGAPPSFPTLPQFNPQGFQQSPGYQFALSQGTDAAQNLATRSQGTIGGNTLKALQTYGTGVANQDYYNWLQNVYAPTYQSQLQNTLLPYQANTSNYWSLLNAFNQAQSNQFSRLSGLAGAGQNAAVAQGGFGQNFGSQAGQNVIGAGNALAAGRVGAANSITGGVNSLSNNLLSPSVGGNSNIGNIGNALASLFGGGGPNTSYLNNPDVVNALWSNPNIYSGGDFSSASF